jgi:hypothetical protein
LVMSVVSSNRGHKSETIVMGGRFLGRKAVSPKYATTWSYRVLVSATTGASGALARVHQSATGIVVPFSINTRTAVFQLARLLILYVEAKAAKSPYMRGPC